MDDIRTDTAGFGTSGMETTETQSAPPVRGARRVALAGLGAVASACDNAETTFDRLVNRGERVREDWQGKAGEVRRQNAGTRERMRDYFRSAMDTFLDGVNVPNKADVDTINVKLNILTRKIDDLQMQQMPEAPGGTPASTGTVSIDPEPGGTGDLAT